MNLTFILPVTWFTHEGPCADAIVTSPFCKKFGIIFALFNY